MKKFYVEHELYPGKLFAFDDEEAYQYHMENSEGFTALAEEEAAAYGEEAINKACDPIMYICLTPLPQGANAF